MGLHFTAICARVAMCLFAFVRVMTSTEGDDPASAPEAKSRLKDHARRCQMIVRGRVRRTLAFRGRSQEGEDLILTRATLDVGECLKGEAGTSLELLVEGGTIDGITVRPHNVPGVNDGDELVVFVDRQKAGRPAGSLRLFKLSPSRRVLGLGLTLEDVRALVHATLPVPT